MALLIKAMLVHGAEWGSLTEKYAEVLGLYTKEGKISRQDCSRKLHRFLGYGRPDINRAVECAKKRITLLGYGNIKAGDAFTYDLPLPFNLSSEKLIRRLTATLAYFSPIVSTRQKYRSVQCWYTIENGIKTCLTQELMQIGRQQFVVLYNTKSSRTMKLSFGMRMVFSKLKLTVVVMLMRASKVLFPMH
jgi:hypothetical protein